MFGVIARSPGISDIEVSTQLFPAIPAPAFWVPPIACTRTADRAQDLLDWMIDNRIVSCSVEPWRPARLPAFVTAAQCASPAQRCCFPAPDALFRIAHIC